MSDDPSIPDISPEGAVRAFHDHLAMKAREARAAYGPTIDADAIERMLEDRAVVRHPTSLVFDDGPLEAHEFAFAKPVGFHASDGIALCVHPAFKDRRDALPLLVAYHIPAINYGSMADAEGCELYGSVLLGMEMDEYYHALCALADTIGAVPITEPEA